MSTAAPPAADDPTAAAIPAPPEKLSVGAGLR